MQREDLGAADHPGRVDPSRLSSGVATLGVLSAAEQAVEGSGAAIVDGLRLGLVILIGISTATGAMVMIGKSPLGRAMRWVWGRLVSEPLRTWHQDAVDEVIEARVKPITTANSDRIDFLVSELTTNGGSSVKDQVTSLVAGQRRLFSMLGEHRDRLEAVEDHLTRRT